MNNGHKSILSPCKQGAVCGGSDGACAEPLVATRSPVATGGSHASENRDRWHANVADGSSRTQIVCGRFLTPLCTGVVRLFAALLFVVGGCHSAGTINVIPAATQKLSTTAPLIEVIRPTECYYWVTDDDELRIAMRQHRKSISRLKREEFILSVVLRGLPAGAGRDYRASRQTMRAQHWKGFSHNRLASFGGIVAVWDYGKRKLRGRVRLPSKRQAYSFLTGWGGDQPLLIVGEFTAVADREKGEAILERTEKRGMQRGPEPARARKTQGPRRRPKATAIPKASQN